MEVIWIGISGQMGSGKDTAGSMLAEWPRLDPEGAPWDKSVRVAYADALKDSLSALLPLLAGPMAGSQAEKAARIDDVRGSTRQFMQSYGQLLREQLPALLIKNGVWAPEDLQDVTFWPGGFWEWVLEQHVRSILQEHQERWARGVGRGWWAEPRRCAVLVTDVRYPTEAAQILSQHVGHVVRLRRGLDAGGGVVGHASEQDPTLAWAGHRRLHVIDNRELTLDELRAKLYDGLRGV